MIKISIVVPVYNVAHYIKKCVNSIMAQNSKDYSVECIIVDDCSPDNSIEIIHDLVDNYVGNIEFVFCRHNHNRGQSAARNTGIEKSTGDYVLFLDSDDYLSEDCIKLMIQGLSAYPETDVILGNMYYCKYNRPFFPLVSSPTLLSDKSDLLLKIFFAKLHCHAPNRLIRRSLLIDHHLFFIEGLLYEDMPWTYDLMMAMSSMLVLPDITYVYENNETSTMNSTKQNINKEVYSFCYIIDYFLDNIYYNVRSNCRIYCFGILLRILDSTTKYHCSVDMKKMLGRTKRRLVKEAVCSARLLMALFFMTSFKPFVGVYKMRFSRSCYHKVTILFSVVENFLDNL